MTTPTRPAWWPPSGYEELTEAQVRELFAYLRTVIRPVMDDARRRIQTEKQRARLNTITSAPSSSSTGERGERASGKNLEAADDRGHAGPRWSSSDSIDRRDDDGRPEPTAPPPGWQDDHRRVYGQVYREAAS